MSKTDANSKKRADNPPKLTPSRRPLLKVDKKSKQCYPNWDLKRKFISELEQLITTRLDAVGINGEDRRSLLSELFQNLTAEVQQIKLPTHAPELYAERTDRSEKPEDFLDRVYKGLTGTPDRPAKIVRSHIKAWDPRLYEALYKRRKSIDNFEIILPPSQGRSVDDLSRPEADHLAALRRAAREGMARLRSKRKSIG